MRKGFANSTSSRWNADASELTSFWPSKFSKEKLTLTRLNSYSTHPEPVYEGTPTESCKDQAVFDEGASSSQFGLWNSGTDFRHIQSCHPQYLSSKNSWTSHGPKSSRQHLCNFCPPLLTIFSILIAQAFYVFPHPPIPNPLMWSLLALVAIPTINQLIKKIKIKKVWYYPENIPKKLIFN